MEKITIFLLIRLLRLLVGIISFIGLLTLDVWKAWKSKAHWVPQGALVLSAFSIQLLDLLDTHTVSITDYPANRRYDLELVLKNELLIDGGRVMVCVYMDYLLPEMARSPSQRVVWSDIGALALSLFTHIFSELYAFNELYQNLRKDKIPVNPLSIVSRVCTMVCAILLFLLLGSAAFAGRTLYNLVLEKIPLVLRTEPKDYLMNFYRPENVEKDVLRSWVVAWVCKPDYVITRSVLASSVGTVVTASVGCFAAEWITQDYKVLHFGDGIDWFRITVTAFMALLILIGWGIIFYRWMFAIYYFPGRYKIANQGYFHVEDFWIRHIFEVMDNIEYRRQSWDERVSGGGLLENLKLRFLRTIKAYNLLCRPLLLLQRSIILFSKLCCFLSGTFLSADKTESRMGAVDADFDDFHEELEKIMMPGETQKSLFAASVKALKQMKDFMAKGREEGMKSERLVQLLVIGSTDQNSEGAKFLDILRERLSRDLRFEYLTKLSWKMTALSLIQVIIELNDHATDNVVDAYDEASEFLDLLDNPVGTGTVFSTELFVRAADKRFLIIKQKLDRAKGHTPRNTGTVHEARQKVMALQQNATKLVSTNPNDSVDWWEIAANNSLDKVCTIIVENDTSSGTDHYTEFTIKVRKLLADMLTIALKEEVGRELVNDCREWAGMLEDEKIKASVYIAGKLSGVIAKLSGIMRPDASDEDMRVGNLRAFNITA